MEADHRFDLLRADGRVLAVRREHEADEQRGCEHDEHEPDVLQDSDEPGVGVQVVGGGDDPGAGSDGSLTVYSGRSEKLVGPLLKRFEKESGVKLEVRYGESAELAATLAEEGDNSPAELFFSQDAGALGAVANAGLLTEIPPATRGRVDARWVDPEGRWVGTSGRSRVIAYSTERVREDELPQSIFDFTKPAWKGRIGFAPPNASFQAFVSAMRLGVGQERTKAWLEGIKANDHHEGTMVESIDKHTWIAMSVERAVGNVQSRLSNGMALLATVGSTSPFVGLFGTTWGIYEALVKIGLSGQASIDKVAGPVGAALLLTAIGLVVAVPAVMGYNWLVRRNKVVLDQTRAFAGDLQNVLLSGKR